MCERTNRSGLPSLLVQNVEEECGRIEGAFANEAQRKTIFALQRRLPVRPRALIINGDLTNFGHKYQLDLFRVRATIV